MHGANAVTNHYTRVGTLQAILEALLTAGKDLSRLAPTDLAAVDEFHIRGREATVELAQRANLTPGQRVLDIGCGLGGSVRYLAAEHECRVTGIDLTPSYVELARTLTERVGLHGRVDYRVASALDLPFDDAGFDVVWTEHAQMNIADKCRFYSEAVRVLAPGGQFVFHDFFRGPAGLPHFPVPWADEAGISFLISPDEARRLLDACALAIHDWQDKSAQSRDWLAAKLAETERTGPPPLGLHLLMGERTRLKFENVVRNLSEQRVVVYQGVAVRQAPH